MKPAGDLSTRRRRLWTVILGAIGGSLLVAYVAIWITAVDPQRERGSDFSASYVAAQLVGRGDGARLYDQGAERAAHAALLPPGTRFDLPFLTPPTTAAMVLPLTALDAGTAFRVFSALQLLLLGAALVITARAAPWPDSARRNPAIAVALAGLAGVATAVMLLLGQWDGLGALGLAVAYAAWRRDHDAVAAAVLATSAMLAKPHLAVGLAAFLIGRRRIKELGAALTAVAVVGVLWVGIVGIQGLRDYVETLTSTLSHTPPASTLGLSGLLTSLFGETSGPENAALVLGGLALIPCIWLGVRSRAPGSLEISLAGATALSLLAAPHLLAHDLVLLAPPFVWVAARIANSDHPWPIPELRRLFVAWLAFNVLVVMDAGSGGVGFPGRVAPWGLLACGCGAVVVLRARPATPTDARAAS